MDDFFALITRYPSELWAGFLITLQLLIVSTLGGFALSLPLALALHARRLWLKLPAELYSLFFRGSPMFVQLFLIYYGLPVLLREFYGSPFLLRQSFWWPLVSSPFALASIAFILNLAAYMAEDIRGGLRSVPRGEREAAIACGMSTAVMIYRILLPQALRRSAPALFNHVIISLKATALVSIIAMRDLMGVGSLAFNQTFNLGAYLLLGVIYLLLVFALTRLFSLLEKRYILPAQA